MWEFTKDVPPSTYQSLKLAGVNGADVLVNMVPLFDRLFSLDPNYQTNQKLMTTMKNWSNHLDGARENIKAKRDQNQKVAQFVSMIFQDVPYAVPLHKKFKNMGMPKWLSMPLAYGLGYALGFDEEKTSLFLNSKDVRAIKDLVNILLQIIIVYNLLNILFIETFNLVASFFIDFFISSVASEGSSLINEGVTKFDLFTVSFNS